MQKEGPFRRHPPCARIRRWRNGYRNPTVLGPSGAVSGTARYRAVRPAPGRPGAPVDPFFALRRAGCPDSEPGKYL